MCHRPRGAGGLRRMSSCCEHPPGGRRREKTVHRFFGNSYTCKFHLFPDPDRAGRPFACAVVPTARSGEGAVSGFVLPRLRSCPSCAWLTGLAKQKGARKHTQPSIETRFAGDETQGPCRTTIRVCSGSDGGVLWFWPWRVRPSSFARCLARRRPRVCCRLRGQGLHQGAWPRTVSS